MLNTAIRHLTLEDCMTLSDAGFEIWVNDGLPYVNYKEEDDIYNYLSNGDTSYSIE